MALQNLRELNDLFPEFFDVAGPFHINHNKSRDVVSRLTALIFAPYPSMIPACSIFLIRSATAGMDKPTTLLISVAEAFPFRFKIVKFCHQCDPYVVTILYKYL